MSGIRRGPVRPIAPAAAPAIAAAPTGSRGRRAAGATYSSRPVSTSTSTSTSTAARLKPGFRQNAANRDSNAARASGVTGGAKDTVTVDGKKYRKSTYIGKREVNIGQLRTQVGTLEQRLSDSSLNSTERTTLQRRLDSARGKFDFESDMAKSVEAAHRMAAPESVVRALDAETIAPVANNLLDSDAAYDGTSDSIKVQEKAFTSMVDAIEAVDRNGVITPEKRAKMENYARRAASYITLIGAHEATHAADRDSGAAARGEQVITSTARKLFSGVATPAQKTAAENKLLRTYVAEEEYRAYRNQESAQAAMGAAPKNFLTRDDKSGNAISKNAAVSEIVNFMPADGREHLKSEIVREATSPDTAATLARPAWRVYRGESNTAAASPAGSGLDVNKPAWRVYRGEARASAPATAPGSGLDINKPAWRVYRGKAIAAAPATPTPANAGLDIDKPAWRVYRGSLLAPEYSG